MHFFSVKDNDKADNHVIVFQYFNLDADDVVALIANGQHFFTN